MLQLSNFLTSTVMYSSLFLCAHSPLTPFLTHSLSHHTTLSSIYISETSEALADENAFDDVDIEATLEMVSGIHLSLSLFHSLSLSLSLSLSHTHRRSPTHTLAHNLILSSLSTIGRINSCPLLRYSSLPICLTVCLSLSMWCVCMCVYVCVCVCVCVGASTRRT